MRKHKHMAVYVALILVATFVLYAVQKQTVDRLRSNQLAACERENHFREVLSANERAFSDFLGDAIAVRKAAGEVFWKSGNKVQAKLNMDVAAKYILERASLRKVEFVNCHKVIK